MEAENRLWRHQLEAILQVRTCGDEEMARLLNMSHNGFRKLVANRDRKGFQARSRTRSTIAERYAIWVASRTIPTRLVAQTIRAAIKEE